MTATLQSDLKFENFKRHPKRNIFESIFWLNGSFFRGDRRYILKEEVKTYLMAHVPPLNSTIFISSAHI
jgi:hypothetical protein